MSYRIELRPAAIRALKHIDHQQRDTIVLLGEDPRPPGAKALQGRPGYRVRVGDYRIVYMIHDDVLLVVVVTLGHRREIYGREQKGVSPISGLRTSGSGSTHVRHVAECPARGVGGVGACPD